MMQLQSVYSERVWSPNCLHKRPTTKTPGQKNEVRSVQHKHRVPTCRHSLALAV
ncbi:hypothetical protein BV22DRAFT_1037420, partial [Leucogyrophana mollusca]